MLHSHRAHWHSLQTALQQWAHGAGALPIRFLQLGGFLLVYFSPFSHFFLFLHTSHRAARALRHQELVSPTLQRANV